MSKRYIPATEDVGKRYGRLVVLRVYKRDGLDAVSSAIRRIEVWARDGK